MFRRLARLLTRRSLTQRFTLISFVIVILGAFGIGWWVGEQIKTDVIQDTAATTALYMDSFIAPNLQELSYSQSLTPEHTAVLRSLLGATPLGQQVVTFKVWDETGRVVYSTNSALIGRAFPPDEEQVRSWQGEVVAGISDLQNAENVEDRKYGPRLLQIYSPVRLNGTGTVIAVAEFYQSVGALEAEISAAQTRGWLIVGSVMIVIYLLLVGFVRRADVTIRFQEAKLRQQVTQLTAVLRQNSTLHDRVRRAAGRVATLDERTLRRISAELHDGPSQELGLALLRVDDLLGQQESVSRDTVELPDRLSEVRAGLQRALQEVRALATGLGLPELDGLTVSEVITRAVRAHERRTGSKVELRLDTLPIRAPASIKTTTYRLIQEALTNSYRHAGGVGQSVHARVDRGDLEIDIGDHGPGFDTKQALDSEDHLGLTGMRERVESLAGQLQIESAPGAETHLRARLTLQGAGGEDVGEHATGDHR
jgi:signal transduction histidine kinase